MKQQIDFVVTVELDYKKGINKGLVKMMESFINNIYIRCTDEVIKNFESECVDPNILHDSSVDYFTGLVKGFFLHKISTKTGLCDKVAYFKKNRKGIFLNQFIDVE